jgi:hypothetical protein
VDHHYLKLSFHHILCNQKVSEYTSM